LGAIQKCIGESALAVFLGAEIVKDSTKMSKVYLNIIFIFNNILDC